MGSPQSSFHQIASIRSTLSLVYQTHHRWTRFQRFKTEHGILPRSKHRLTILTRNWKTHPVCLGQYKYLRACHQLEPTFSQDLSARNENSKIFSDQLQLQLISSSKATCF